jgi:RND family efflux transporter MFP subunit
MCFYLSAAEAVEFDCVTEASQIVEIRSTVEGLVDRVFIDRGDIVKAGQVMALLDSRIEKVNAEFARYKATMKGTLKTAEHRAEFAKIKAGRREKMSAEDYMSAQDRDEAVAESLLSESQLVETMENQRLFELEYERANVQLSLRTVKSPINGVVIERLVNAGEYSDTRDQHRPIARVADIYLLHVEALLPLWALGKVRPGGEAVVLPEGPVNGRHVAKIKVVDRVIDAASGTFGVRLELSNPRLDIPAGIKCKVSFRDITVDGSAATDRRASIRPVPDPAPRRNSN